MAETELEEYIRYFVHTKTAERVAIHLLSSISIKHVLKSGSTLLAVFWAKVLQHPKNFPQEKFSYKRLHDKTTGTDKLILKAEDVTFTVFMGSGTLMLQGSCAYEFFRHRLREVLDNYDDEVQYGWQYIPFNNPPVKTFKEKNVEHCKTDTEEYLSMLSRQHKSEVVATLDVNESKYADDLISGLEKLSVSEQSLLSGQDLEKDLSSIQHGALRDGRSYIYPLWKYLLKKWFSEKDTKIYIVTPFLDMIRFKDIVDAFLENPDKGNLEAFYVRRNCDENNRKLAMDLKEEVISNYDRKDQTLIQYRIFRNVIYPPSRFHAKFIAGVKEGLAEVLVTSANFHGNHFGCQNLETVSFHKIVEDKFIDGYIKPISAGVVIQT